MALNLSRFAAGLGLENAAFLSGCHHTAGPPIQEFLSPQIRGGFPTLRGVDGLIWTIILSHAFGPGPMTGALAILITDTGSFGKMFSETLENIRHRRDCRWRHRAVADPSHHHPKRRGGGQLLYGADRADGHGDGYLFGLAAQTADQGVIRALTRHECPQ